MRTLNKLIDAIIFALAGIAGAMIFALLLMVGFATISRYLVSKPYAFLIDYTAYALVYIAFLGAPWLYSKRGHVGIDILINALPKKLKPAWIAMTDIVVLIVCIVIGVISFRVVMDSYNAGVIVSDYLSTPKWLLILPIPIGLLFLAVQAIRNAIDVLKPKKAAEGGVL